MPHSQRLPPWPDLAALQPIFDAARIVGLYEWDIAGDRIFPCLGMTRIFGLDGTTIREGAPCSAFVPALHPRDRHAFRERIDAPPRGIEQTIYRVSAGGDEPARAILDVIRVSVDGQGRPDWACGALFDYPGPQLPATQRDSHRVLTTLDSAARLAIELRQIVQDIESSTLHTLTDMLLVEIASSLARQMQRPETRLLN